MVGWSHGWEGNWPFRRREDEEMNEKTMKGGSRHVRTDRPLIRDGLRRMAANIEYCARRRARAQLAELMDSQAVELGLIMYDEIPAERLDGRGPLSESWAVRAQRRSSTRAEAGAGMWAGAVTRDEKPLAESGRLIDDGTIHLLEGDVR